MTHTSLEKIIKRQGMLFPNFSGSLLLEITDEFPPPEGPQPCTPSSLSAPFRAEALSRGWERHKGAPALHQALASWCPQVVSGQSPDGHTSHLHPDSLPAPSHPTPPASSGPPSSTSGVPTPAPRLPFLPRTAAQARPALRPRVPEAGSALAGPGPVGRARGAIKWRALCTGYPGAPVSACRPGPPYPRHDFATASSAANQRTTGALADFIYK
ncbi:vegetative cell wall protein gp1-like [Neovison vison]|uniref:vegetative cell wall protein gp1-like n=1 Tax=Neovison vison TaxID=452646 RepID=UPI001CF015A5|nr:vegetative cell wall protein gp1-like [Neogale vison]